MKSPGPATPVQPRRALATKTGWSALAGLMASGAGFVASVAVARLLGPADAGAVALVTWVALTAAQVAGLGLPQAATRYLAAGLQGEGTGLVRWLWRWTVGSALAAVVAGGATWLAITGGGAPSLLAALAVLAVAQAMAALAFALAAGRQDFRAMARANGLAGLAVVAGVPAGAVLGGAAGAALGYTAGPLVLLAALRAPGHASGLLSQEVRARVLRFALGGWIASVVSLVTWSRLELLFLERSWGREGVAMYSVALTTAQLATQPVALLGGALMAHLAERLASDGPAGAFQSYRAATRLLAALAFPLTAWVTLASPVLIPLLYGRPFASAVPAALATTVVAGVGVVATVGSSLVYAMEKARFIAVSGVVAAVVAVAAFAIFIPAWGPLGAGIARAGVQLAGVAAGALYIWRWLGAPVPWRALGAASLGAAAAAALAWVALQLPLPPLLALAASGFVMAGTYSLLARLLGIFESEDLGRLAPVVDRLPAGVQGPVHAILRWMVA